MGPDQRKRLERFIVAYNGEIREDEGSPDITHLVWEESKVRSILSKVHTVKLN